MPTKMPKDLTPQEKNIVQYHRDNVTFNNVGKGPEGEPVTVYSTGVTMDSGPYKGKSVTVPGYIQGKQYEDPDLIRDYWRSDINKGKYPVYDTPEQGDKRAKEIHKIMDDEVGAAEKAGKASKSQQYKKGGKVSASSRADGAAQRGKTRGRIV